MNLLSLFNDLRPSRKHQLLRKGESLFYYDHEGNESKVLGGVAEVESMTAVIQPIDFMVSTAKFEQMQNELPDFFTVKKRQ